MLTIINNDSMVEEYDYEELYEGMKDVDRNRFFKNLYKRSKAGEIHAYCTCIKNQDIPLVISKKIDTYYVRRQDASIQHSPLCRFDGEYVNCLKGWDVLANGFIHVTLQNRMFSSKEYINPNTPSFLTLREFTERYMGFIWELQSKYCLKNNKSNLQFKEFYSGLQYWAQRIKFTEKYSLKDLIGINKTKAYSLLKDHMRMFVIMRLDKIEKVDKKNLILCLRNIDSNISLELTCSSGLWKESTRLINVTKTPVMVSGFVELIKDKPLNFVNLAVITISNEGVVLNNEYEKKIINILHQKKRHFIKSYETFKVFEHIKPSILLIDTNPMTILEIIENGIEDKDYMCEMEKKFNYYNSLHNFKIMTWDAFNNDKLFKL